MMARRFHTARNGLRSVRLGSGGWVHFDDSPENRIDVERGTSGRSSSRVVEGAFEAPWSGPVAAAVKIADGEDGARPRLRSEANAYRALRDLPVLRVFGYRRQRHMDVLVLERGLFSLDALLSARPTERSALQDPMVRSSAFSVITETATMAGASLIRVLRALVTSAEAEHPSGHGDIRLENLLMVSRDEVLQVVLADWGAPSRVVDIDGDIDAAGLALWELLHDGRTPFTLGSGTAMLRRDDLRLVRQRRELVLDTSACNDAGDCALDGAHDTDDSAHAAVHRFAAAILNAGRGHAPSTRTEVLHGPLAEAVINAGNDIERVQVDGEHRAHPARALARVMAFTDVAVADVHARGWMPSGPPPRGRFGLVERSPRDRRPIARLRRLASPPRLWALVGAVAVGLVVGRLASVGVQLMPESSIVSATSERAASVIVAASLLVIAVVTGGIAWVLGRGVPRSHHVAFLERWSPVAASVGFVTALIGVGTWAMSSLWSPPSPSGASTGPWPEVVAAGAGVAAVGVNAIFETALERLRYGARFRRGRRWTVWMPTATAVALAGTVILGAGLLNGFVGPTTLPASAEKISMGMAGEEPAFFNPDGIAAAGDGSIAVLERFADESDTVWIKRPGSTWNPEVRIPHKRVNASQPREANSSPFDALATTLPGLASGSGVPLGDRLTSISDIGFLDPGHLAVIGLEGVSVIDLTTGVPSARVVDAGVRAAAFDRDASLAIVSDGILVTEFDTGAFASAHPGELSRWNALAPCPDASKYVPKTLYVVKITNPLGEARVAAPTWPSLSGGECRRDAWTIVSDGSAGAVIERVNDGSSNNLTYRPLDDRPSVRLTEMWTGYVAPGVEHGGRLFFPIGQCLQGFTFDPVESPLPKIADRTWYTPSADDDKCRQPAGTPGFIGAEVESGVEPTPRAPDGSDTSSVQTQKTDTCVPPRAGVSVLDVGEWAQKPMAVTLDGSILLTSPAGASCTSMLWSLGPRSTDWVPQVDVVAERMDDGATTMFAVSPEPVVGGAAWFAPSSWLILSEDGSSKSPWTGETGTYRALSPRVLSVGGATITGVVGYIVGTDPAIDRTKLVVDYDDPGLADVEMPLPGVRDLAVTRSAATTTDTVVVALCDGIVSFDAAKLSGTPTAPGHIVPSADSFTQVAGTSDPVADVKLDAPPSCGAVATAPMDAQGETTFELRPTAVDAVNIGDAIVVAYAETGTFADQRVSRVRIIDPGGRLGGGEEGDVAYTLGCDEAPTYDGTCLGDLEGLGLEASDIAIAEDGAVAVSTTSADGWGPVLLYRHGERRVVRLDPGVLASGVAWSGGRLIVTDAARGDVFALTFSD